MIIKSTDDQLMTAKLVKEDDCIFTGYMVGCPESTAVVTGCGGVSQRVQIQSDVFGDMAFTTQKMELCNPWSYILNQRGTKETLEI